MSTHKKMCNVGGKISPFLISANFLKAKHGLVNEGRILGQYFVTKGKPFSAQRKKEKKKKIE